MWLAVHVLFLDIWKLEISLVSIPVSNRLYICMYYNIYIYTCPCVILDNPVKYIKPPPLCPNKNPWVDPMPKPPSFRISGGCTPWCTFSVATARAAAKAAARRSRALGCRARRDICRISGSELSPGEMDRSFKMFMWIIYIWNNMYIYIFIFILIYTVYTIHALLYIYICMCVCYMCVYQQLWGSWWIYIIYGWFMVWQLVYW